MLRSSLWGPSGPRARRYAGFALGELLGGVSNAPKLAPILSQNGAKMGPGTLLETSWLVCLLVPLLWPAESILERSGEPFGVSCRPLGASWQPFARSGWLRRRSFGDLGSFLGGSWSPLESLGALLGSLGALLEPLGRVSGASWDALGSIWETSAKVLEAISELGMRL